MSHSDSDSDSLNEEFESADEDIKGEDIDIAELGLDDDENDTFNSKPAQSNLILKVNEQPNSPNNDVPIENKPIESTNPQTKPETTYTTQTETKPLEINNQSEETKTSAVETKTEEHLDIVEGDDEIDQLLEELNVKETQENTDEQPASQIVEEIKVSEDKTDIKSGWDDTELSDLDDEELVSNLAINEQIEEAKSESKDDMKKAAETNKEENKSKQSGWSWSSFGSIVSNATSSVANVASQLGTGLNTVLETVEQTIGAPDPVQLAIMAKNSKKELEEKNKDEQETENNEANDLNDWNNDDQEWFTINSIASKGSQLVAGSFNVLETVGKKTFETINDKDPNLRKTRGLLSKTISTSQKPNLSQLLREAQQAREQNINSNRSDMPNRPLKNQVDKLTFGLFFDEFKGAANLEALEMLSQQASVKVEMKGSQAKYKLKFKQIDSLFNPDYLNDDFDGTEDNEEQEAENSQFNFLDSFANLTNKNKTFDSEIFESLIEDYCDNLSYRIKIDKLVSAFQSSTLAIKEMSDPLELFNESIKSFALITSKLIESYQKLAETILIDQNQKSSSDSSKILENSQYLFQITRLCIRSITLLADDFSKKCRSTSNEPNTKSLNQITTDIYLEASNSSTYIGDTFLMFKPIFKSQLIDDK